MEEACEYGLTRGTCFDARRLEVVAVARLLWIYCVVCFFSVWWHFVFFLFDFFSSNAHGLLQVRAVPRLMYLSTSNVTRPRERSNRGRFFLLAKKPLHTGVRTACQYLISLSVCLSVCLCVTVCVTFGAFTDCESCTRPISTNPGSMEGGEYGLTRVTCFLACRLELEAAVDFVVCFRWGGGFSVFFRFFFSSNAHRLLQA